MIAACTKPAKTKLVVNVNSDNDPVKIRDFSFINNRGKMKHFDIPPGR